MVISTFFIIKEIQLRRCLTKTIRSQSGWGLSGPLEVSWSNPPAQAGPPR